MTHHDVQQLVEMWGISISIGLLLWLFGIVVVGVCFYFIISVWRWCLRGADPMNYYHRGRWWNKL